MRDEPPKVPVRIRKLRVLALLAGLGLLAIVSTVFGMMMAVASDLPALEEPASQNSVIVDRRGERLGLLTGNTNRILLKETQIAPVMKHAIIAIEDKRFYTNDGVDLRGIGRALYQDVVAKRAVQGGSTIAQQFVKNSLAAQDRRTLFVKLREAALAYHITRRWTKGKILRNYLNTIYFGNGAYGIESAARTYFGRQHPGCERNRARPCAAQLEPDEAAMIAGVVASPSAFDPVAHPAAARMRRDLVLRRMLEQRLIAREQYDAAIAEPVPSRHDVQPPREDTKYPYFTSWIKQQVVDKLGGGQTGARQAFEGGLTVQTTIDGRFQTAADDAINAWLPNPAGPRASLVAIDNRSGEVRAMVGGDDYNATPVQPRHPGPAPAGIGVQAVRARGGAQARDLAGLRLVFAQEGLRRARQQREVHRRELQQRLRRGDLARRRDDDLRQLRLRRGRHQGRHEADLAPGSQDGHPHSGLAQLGDHARRPQAGRHAARHGPRVPDVRAPGQARLRLDEPGCAAQGSAGPRPGRDPLDRPPRGRQDQVGHAPQRQARRATTSAPSGCSTRASPAP